MVLDVIVGASPAQFAIKKVKLYDADAVMVATPAESAGDRDAVAEAILPEARNGTVDSAVATLGVPLLGKEQTLVSEEVARYVIVPRASSLLSVRTESTVRK